MKLSRALVLPFGARCHSDALKTFHPAVAMVPSLYRADARAMAWPAIQSGHALIAAPTGSGKTLAAFLAAIDALVREGAETGSCPTRPSSYTSATEALSRASSKSQAPLAGIREHLLLRLSRCRDPHHRAHRRHAAGRAHGNAQVAATSVTRPNRCTCCSVRIPVGADATAHTVIVDEIHAVAR